MPANKSAGPDQQYALRLIHHQEMLSVARGIRSASIILTIIFCNAPFHFQRDYMCLFALSSHHSKQASYSVFPSVRALYLCSFFSRQDDGFRSPQRPFRQPFSHPHPHEIQPTHARCFGKTSLHSSIKLLRTASRRGETMKLATVRSPVVMMTSAGMPAVRRPLISSGILSSSTSIRAR